MEKIVYLRGLWSHPAATEWIKDNLEKSTELPVELFEYHDLLVEKTNTQTYVKRVKEKFGDLYNKDLDDLVLMGHSHGGTLSAILADSYEPQKIILTNPAFKPWGIFRQVSNQFKNIASKINIGPGYNHHFVVKYDGEIEERSRYFREHFDVMRDLSRILSTGRLALNSLKEIRSDLLLIQSMKDEFVSSNASLRFYDNVELSSYYEDVDDPFKELITVPNGEHAVLEEDGIYPELYEKITEFIKR